MKDIDQEVFEEFKTEGIELLEEAEASLLNIDQGQDFTNNFNSIFRVFHSLKGGAGMLGLELLQSHMHEIEYQFESLKEVGTCSGYQISYFLNAVDLGRQILEENSTTEFDYKSFNEKETSTTIETDEKSFSPGHPQDHELLADDQTESARSVLLPVTGKVLFWQFQHEQEETLLGLCKRNGFDIISFPDLTDFEGIVGEIRPGVLLGTWSGKELGHILKRLKELSPSTQVVSLGTISSDELENCLSYSQLFTCLPFDSTMETVTLSIDRALRTAHQKQQLKTAIRVGFFLYSEVRDKGIENQKVAIGQLVEEDLKNLLRQV